MDALDFPFFQRALVAGLLASVAGGVVGTFVMVRRMVSVAGGLTHAAFGGVGLGYLLGFSPMAGALGFGLASGMGLGLAYRRLSSGLDTLIAMVWAVGMALGMLFIALTPGYAPDLTSYLFGSLVLVSRDYIVLIAAVDFVVLVTVAVLFDHLRAIAFDEEFAEVVAEPVEGLFLLFMGLTSLTVVSLIRVVGVILVIALLSLPAAIAQHWSQNLKRMMFLAVLISAICTTSGLFLSFWISDHYGLDAPAGPLIVLLAASLYGVSNAFKRWKTEVRN
ncbi:MAG TPA: metal ABC transporter permease [Vicinamibacteria bacterium]|jgi:zinc transport system permease protein